MTTSNSNTWQAQFREVYNRGTAAWKEGRDSAGRMFGPEDLKFLASIGCTAQELFDFVDDAQRYGEPDAATALALAEIRRDYFLNVMQGQPTGRIASLDQLPAKTDEVDGIAWLPRLIVKARLKLRGEMPDDLMYCCGGDRAFFEAFHMTPPQFLRLAWEAGDDERRIVAEVKRCAGRK